MKRLIPWVFMLLLACGLIPTPQPTRAPTPAPSPTPTAPPVNAALGTDQNPLILALGPSAHPSLDVLNAGKTLSARLEQSTNYSIVTIIPASETELVQDFDLGNAHIGVLSPFGYLLASQDGKAEAAFTRQQDGQSFYGAQFIVQSDAGFTSYFDEVKHENTAEALQALSQFNGKKPCWSDPLSPSGYVVPLGYLAESGAQPLEPAFVSGQVTVVRAVYATGICDFGATYIDARQFPGLQDEFPDLLKKVVTVWQIPPIIPYDTLTFSGSLSEDMRRALLRAFVDLMSTPDGKSAMQTLYGIDAMQVTQDSQYDDFRQAVKASGLDLSTLVK